MEVRKDKVQLSIEEALMKELRFGGVDKDRLKELVDIVAGIQKAGLKRLKAFTKGTPVPDGLRVSGVVDGGDAARFFTEAFTRTALLGKVELFPYGIPWPEVYVVNIDLGSPIEGGQINQ